jgi:hypothetical protein
MHPTSLRTRDLPYFDITRRTDTKRVESYSVLAMIPCDVKFYDLLVFSGKRTRVTIEVMD